MKAPAKSKAATRTIRARIQRGKIVPVRALKMAEGAEVLVTISPVPSKADQERFKAAAGAWKRSAEAARFAKLAGAWKGSIDAEKLIRDIYRARLTGTRPLTRP